MGKGGGRANGTKTEKEQNVVERWHQNRAPQRPTFALASKYLNLHCNSVSSCSDGCVATRTFQMLSCQHMLLTTCSPNSMPCTHTMEQGPLTEALLPALRFCPLLAASFSLTGFPRAAAGSMRPPMHACCSPLAHSTTFSRSQGHTQCSDSPVPVLLLSALRFCPWLAAGSSSAGCTGAAGDQRTWGRWTRAGRLAADLQPGKHLHRGGYHYLTQHRDSHQQ